MAVRITYDDQIFTRQVRGGISRYFAGLIGELSHDSAVEISLEARWSKSAHLHDLGVSPPLPFSSFGSKRKVLRAFNRLVPSGDRRTIHSTYYESAYMRRASRWEKHVVTVHDMIPELEPALFPRGNPHLEKRRYVDGADAVVCVSEFTADAVARIYGIEENVVAIHSGIDSVFAPARDPLPELPGRYLMFVGGRAGYKDFDVLLEAFSRVHAEFECRLVTVGGGVMSPAERSRVSELGLDGRIHQLVLSDAQLATAYSHALVFVFPSRHEGFGFPTLEAMACGAPVIVPNASVHPEIAGDAAAYFSPGSASELEDLLRQLLGSPAMASQLRARGFERATRFSWAASASKYRDLYANLGQDS